MYFETEKIELKEKLNDQLVKGIEAFLNTDDGSDTLKAGDGQIYRKRWTASGGATQCEKLKKNQK